MALNEVINTSGDIRRLLAQTMVEIKNGEMSVDKGQCIAVLAKEITASMQAEVNVAKVRVSMLSAGKNMGDITHMGKMIIGNDETPMLSGK